MYRLTSGALVIRLNDNAYIPCDPSNTDYQQYLDWLEKGGAPKPLDPPSVGFLAGMERQWRDSELAQADIQLNKIQDGAAQGQKLNGGNTASSCVTGQIHNGFLMRRNARPRRSMPTWPADHDDRRHSGLTAWACARQ